MADQLKDLLAEKNKIRAEIDKMISQATDAAAAAIIKTTTEYKKLSNELKTINGQVKYRLENEKKIRSEFISQEKQINSLSGFNESLASIQRERLSIADNSSKLLLSESKRLTTITDLSNQLVELSAEDLYQRQDISSQIRKQIDEIKKKRGETDELVIALEKEYEYAKNISSLTKGQKEQLEAQYEVYDGIKKTLLGITDTFKTLTSGPAGAFGTILIGAGFAADKIGANVRKFGGFVDSAQFSALGLGMAFDDAEETAMSLSQQFGGLRDISFETQLNTNLIATNMGISGDEAANVVGSFARLNNMSADTAVDMAATTKSMAKAAGLPISKVMKDVANNTEAFALYGKNGGMNMAKAAVAAGKLGVEMDALTKVTDSLLDFETSITNELELGAMLGRNLNLDRARALAFEGDMTGAVKATLDELGGIEEFNKMDVFAKKQAAALLGLSVTEFQSMAANADKLDETSAETVEKFNTMNESFTAFATGPMGTALKNMGGLVIAAGQMTPFLKDMGINLGGMVKSTFQVLKNMVGMVFQGARFVATKVFDPGMLTAFGDKLKGIGSTLADSKLGKGLGSIKDKLMAGVGGAKPPVPGGGVTAPSPAGGADKASAFGKINATSLIKGAAAIAIMAGALWIFAKATQEFGDKVPWTNVFIGIAALGLLGGVAALLGLAGPMILIGAAAMLIASAAFYVFGLASQEVAKGIAMLGPALTAFVPAMVAFTDAPYIQFGIAAAAVALSMGALGMATPLMLIAAVGMLALSGALNLFSTAIPNFANAAAMLGGVDLTPLASLAAMAPLFFFMALSAPGIVVLGAAFTVLSSAMSSLTTSLPAVMDHLSQLVQLDFLPIFGLAAALTALGSALALVAVFGIAALPALLALGVLAGGANALMGGGKDGENAKMDELINEIKGLRADMIAGKIGVNMDGVKVTSRIAGVVDKIGSNSYAKV